MPSILITGGAGFIGVNAADYFSRRGWQVAVLDNLSRPGTRGNLAWLRSRQEVRHYELDVRDAPAVADAVAEARPEVVLHLAGQVAVTTSVRDPREDFLINALGTLNVLEAVRTRRPQAFFINASTNKVYGRMEDLEIRDHGDRYAYGALPEGVDETRPLDFHSPYGCSKGVADQYTVDYARIYGLQTVTMRQSCIYGPRQFGVEDQGWVAWFIIAATQGRQITIYGDGKQCRDVLHVDDLVLAYEAAIAHRDAASGHAFNIGGGAGNVLSLLGLLKLLESHLGRRIDPTFAAWRPGDQPVFVSHVSKATRLLGWRPAISVADGVDQLMTWVQANQALFAS